MTKDVEEGETMDAMQKQKILDVMHTISRIRDGQVHDARVSVSAYWDVLQKVLDLEATLERVETAEEAFKRGYEMGCQDAIFNETGRRLEEVDVPPYAPPRATKPRSEATHHD